jgi:Ser/Thr protein kinase RdoA (MazF antagonist)
MSSSPEGDDPLRTTTPGRSSGPNNGGRSSDVSSPERGLEVVRPFLPPLTEAEIGRVLQAWFPGAKCTGIVHRSSRPYSAGALFTVQHPAGSRTAVSLQEAGPHTAEHPETGRQQPGPALFLKKRLLRFRSAEEAEREHAVIRRLRERRFPTPGVLTAVTGRSSVVRDGVLYELFQSAAGSDLYRDHHSWMVFSRPEHARSAGAMLARFHEAVEGLSLNPGRPHKVMEARFDLARGSVLIADIEIEIAARPALARYLSNKNWRSPVLKACGPWVDRLRPLLKQAAPWVTHGDWHASNLFFSGGRVSSVIDFHLVETTFRCYDLAVAVDRNTIPWLDLLEGRGQVRYDLMRELLRGYTSVMELSGLQKKMLPLLLPVHQLDLALSNVDYYLSVEKNRARADWAFFVYLIEHAQRFSSTWGEGVIGRISGIMDEF